MIRRRRWRQALVLMALALVGVVLLLRTERASAAVCAELRQRLPAALGTDVSIGACSIDPLTLSVQLEQVELREPQAVRPLAVAERAEVSLRGVFFGGVAFQRVLLVRPRVDVDLERPAEGQKARGCFVDALKRVRVKSLEVQEGAVTVRLPQGELVRLDGVDLTASLTRRAADVELVARGGMASPGNDRQLALGRTAVEASLDLDGREADVRRADLSVEGLTLVAQGKIESLCDAMPTLAVTGQSFVPVASLARFGLPLDDAAGQAWARLAISGRADSPLVRAEVQGAKVTIGPFTPGDFSARVALSSGVLKIEDLTTRAGEGEAHLTGDVQLTQGLPVHLKVEASGLSFAKTLERAGVGGSWVEFPATLKAALSGRLAPKLALAGDVDFRTGRFTLTNQAWDRPKKTGRTILTFDQSLGTFRVAIGEQWVSFEGMDVRVGAEGRTRVTGDAKLFYDPRRGIEVHAASDAVDLSDFGHISEIPWRGTGTTRLSVTGAGPTLLVDGQVTLRDFNYDGYNLGVVQGPVHYAGHTLSFPAIGAQKGRTQYFGALDIVFDEPLWTRATVQVPEGRVEDVVDVLVELSPTMQNLQGPLTGKVSAIGSFDSPAKEFAGLLALDVSEVEYYQRRLGAARGVVRFEHGDAMVLEPCVFEGPLGRFNAGGTWLFKGPLDYQLSIENGSLAELIDPKGADSVAVGGTFTSKAQVGGDSDVIKVAGQLDSSEVSWKGRGVGPMHLVLSETARDITVDGQVIGGVKGHLDLSARNEWPFDSRFSVDLPDLAAFLPASTGGLVAGLGGAVSVSGPMKTFSAVHASARLDRVKVARGEVTAANTEPVELVYDNGGLLVRSFALKGPTTELAAEGAWGPSTVDLRTRGSIDLRLLSSFVPDVERTAGRVDFTAAFTGPVKNPGLAGSAELTDGRLVVKGQDLAVRSLSGRANFSESRVLIQDVQGFLNDGRMRVHGDVRLDKLAVASTELDVDLEDVTVQARPDVPATLSGALQFAQKNGRAQLVGSVDVVKLHYTQPMQLEAVLQSARKKSVPQDDKPNEWLWLNVNVAAGNDVRVENDLARLRLLGKVTLTGTNVKPVLVGAFEAAEGAQAYFRHNTYAIGRALVQFNGLWPTFDVSASTQVREYLVSVKAFGKLEDPKIALSSEPPLSEADIVSLLTLGVTTRETVAAQNGLGIAAEALFSATGLDQEVQHFLQNKVGLKDQQVRLTTTFNEVTGTAEPSVTWESKVSDKLKLGVTQPVSGKGTRAQAEYRFNQRVSARAQWDNQYQNTSLGNPGVDLRFRFEWE